MAIDFKTPDDIATEYLTHLKGLKPEVNTDQIDSDWYIRGRVVGGVVSGAYADQRKISDDAFPQSARREGVQRHLSTFLDDDFNDATPANGNVMVTGTVSSFMPQGTQFVYSPNGNTYQTTEDLTLDAATGSVPVESVSTGQAQNLLAGSSLTLSSPPSGFGSTGTVLSGGIADGRDAETTEEGAARVLAFIQSPPAGGTEADYQRFATDASPSVTGAKVQRFIYGLGTVGLFITSGTTNIDQAIDNDEAIVRTPSDELIETVLEYVDAVNPIDDCLHVLAPGEIEQDVTVRVKYPTGMDGTTVIAGQTLTLNELVQREVKRALYKIPIGGRLIGNTGYVLASELEEALDQSLSASPYAEGTIAQVLLDRQVDDLAASGANRRVLSSEIVKNGTITVVEL